MASVSSRFKINKTVINKLDKAAVKALEQTGDYIHNDVVQAQVVPRLSGALQNEKMFVDYSVSKNGKVSIVHEGPYARRLYFHPEYNFTKDENPNAKGKWFDDWLPGGMKEKQVIKAYKFFYKRLAGVK